MSQSAMSEIAVSAALRSIAVGILVFERGGGIVWANPAAEALLGLRRLENGSYGLPTWVVTELDGRRLADADLPYARVFVDDTPIVGRRCAFEWSDGRHVMVSIHTSRVVTEGMDVAIAVVTDISSQVVAEMARAKHEKDSLIVAQQLRVAQQAEAMGALAGGVAHDFNNHLLVIKNCAEFLMEDLAGNANAMRDLGQISQAVDRAEALTRQLLALSRRQAMEMMDLSVNEVVGDMAKTLQRALGAGFTMKLDLAGELSMTRADPGQVQQIVLMLMLNAKDTMGGQGAITVSTRDVEIDARHKDMSRVPNAGRYVSISVSDNGKSVDTLALSRVIDPFYAAEASASGKGVGLAQVFRIARQHAGGFAIEARATGGTEYRIFLPASAAKVAPATSPAVSAPPVSPRVEGSSVSKADAAVVLVVDDDDAVRAIVIRMLEDVGHRVIEAASGKDVMKILRAQHVDLVLTDIVMPDKEGIEICREIRREFPNKKVVAMSGAKGGTTYLTIAEKMGADYTLSKPFSVADLVEVVNKALKRNS